MKYKLEIELENDNKCYGCPCMVLWSCREHYDGVPYVRPKECPLKPVDEKKDIIRKLKETSYFLQEMNQEEFIKRLESVDVGDTKVYAKIERILEGEDEKVES